MNEVTSSAQVQGQLWVVEQFQKSQLQIVDMKSSKVMTWSNHNNCPKLQMSKLKGNNWAVELAEVFKQKYYFWIKPSTMSQMSLHGSALSPKIAVDSIDRTLDIALWQFIKCDFQGEQYKGLVSIQSLTSKLALQVPQHSIKQGISIVQAKYRGYGHQRWIIQKNSIYSKQSNEYFIRNFFSALLLTAHFYKFQNRVTQQPFSDSINQRWHLQAIEQKIFLIRPKSNKVLHLAVSSQKQGSFVILAQQGANANWVIEGCDPRIES